VKELTDEGRNVMGKIVKRMVVADVAGIEYYSGDLDHLGLAILRANLRRDKHSVVCLVELDEADDAVIQSLIGEAETSSVDNIVPDDKYRNYSKALLLLKERAKTVAFSRYLLGDYLESWKLIPALDR
jgi:hypothetical protein